MAVMGFDVYNMASTGEISKTLNAIRSDSDHVPVVILNDQGGDVMNVSDGVTATLRVQDHGHPPVICFEPGIAKREGRDNRFVENECTTLRANMGDNQPAVCYGISRSLLKGGENGGGIPLGEGIQPAMTANGCGAVCYEAPKRDVLVFKERAGCPGGGKGILIGDNQSFTLATIRDQSVCFAIAGNAVDRNTKQNGTWVTEDISPTLNTQDKHAVCYEEE